MKKPHRKILKFFYDLDDKNIMKLMQTMAKSHDTISISTPPPPPPYFYVLKVVFLSFRLLEAER
jgi:hypothetical protein